MFNTVISNEQAIYVLVGFMALFGPIVIVDEIKYAIGEIKARMAK